VLRKSDQAVLVTGATGFIGRHVVKRLLTSGGVVLALARGRRGLTAEQRIRKIFGPTSRRLKVIEGDLACPNTIRRACAALALHVGTVIHCAGETLSCVETNHQLAPFKLTGLFCSLNCFAP
jgi:nucleoside-diphosphate-sugar epimerase